MSQRPALPVLGPAGPFLDGAPDRRRTISRDADRRVTLGGLAVAAGFIASALASFATGIGIPGSPWAPLHLALAGGAGVAVGAVLPFFTAALAIAPPVDPRSRIAVIALLAAGALGVTVGVAAGAPAIATLGGVLYLLGVAGLALAAFLPLRGGLRSGRSVIVAAYAAALLQVGVGAGRATRFVAGEPWVAGHWAALKPAHGWLNVFGFVSLVIAATLVHLGPTVLGGRIRPRRSADAAVVALAGGPVLVATGFALGLDPLARLGGVVELLGAATLVVFLVRVRRDAGRWTIDLEWHRLTAGSLFAGAAWFCVAALSGGGRLVVLGASPAAWSLEAIVAPVVLGWILQVMVGSWSHLFPAIAPGTPVGHAAARRLLATWATPRLVAWNAGVALVTVGLWMGLEGVVVGGASLVLAAIAVALALVAAVLVQIRRPPGAGAAAASG
jgi:nitrite reductase (NO-forming)